MLIDINFCRERESIKFYDVLGDELLEVFDCFKN